MRAAESAECSGQAHLRIDFDQDILYSVNVQRLQQPDSISARNSLLEKSRAGLYLVLALPLGDQPLTGGYPKWLARACHIRNL